jgi:hypothetical protein
MTDSLPTTSGTTSCKCEAAAQRAVLTYEVADIPASLDRLPQPEQCVGTCSGWAVTIPSLSRIECVLDTDSDLSAASDTLSELSSAGWNVWALVPLPRLTKAHEAFQSRVEFVQGWWENDDSFAFTAPEIP